MLEWEQNTQCGGEEVQREKYIGIYFDWEERWKKEDISDYVGEWASEDVGKRETA